MSLELCGCWADALCVSVCEMLYGALMKGDTMQRWQQVMSLCRGWFICVVVCLLSVTETERRCHSDKMSITHRAGVCFMKADSVLPLFSPLLCSSLPFISSLSQSFHLRADGGVGRRKWGGGARPWPPFISLSLYLSGCPSTPSFAVYLSDKDLNPCDGWVDWGWTPTVPSGSLYGGRKGWSVDDGLGAEKISLHPYIKDLNLCHVLRSVSVPFCVSVYQHGNNRCGIVRNYDTNVFLVQKNGTFLILYLKPYKNAFL